MNSNTNSQSENDTTTTIIEQWNAEQRSIAARVIVHPDPSVAFSSSSSFLDGMSDYVFLPLHSIESNDQLIGGVDVSFAPSTKRRTTPNDTKLDKQYDNGKKEDAIAVYVVYQKDTILLQTNLRFKLDSPYIPSYLAMRELRPIQQLIQTTENSHHHLAAQPEQPPKHNNDDNDRRLLKLDDTTSTPTNEDNTDDEQSQHDEIGAPSPVMGVDRKKHKSPPIADVILVDGNGIMHERCAGIATCLGVSLNRKTIGVGKTLYCFDGFTRNSVNYGVQLRVREFIHWCRCRRDNEFVMGGEGEGERRRRQHQRDCVVMCQNSIHAGDGTDGDESKQMNELDNENIPLLADSMKELSDYCRGFAIPLQGKSGKIWGAALIGHGGKHTMGVGTKVPIYISIGHDMSLQQAVQICAGVSKTRIPEPVRQADLLGREWMRAQYSTSE